jgi:hypothetical protein
MGANYISSLSEFNLATWIIISSFIKINCREIVVMYKQCKWKQRGENDMK